MEGRVFEMGCTSDDTDNGGYLQIRIELNEREFQDYKRKWCTTSDVEVEITEWD